MGNESFDTGTDASEGAHEQVGDPLFLKAERERQTCESVAALYEKGAQGAGAEIGAHPYCEAKGREYPIENGADYLVAYIQKELSAAREVLEGGGGDYAQEKEAAKLVAFLEQKLATVRLYVEMKLYHPPLSGVLEKHFPFGGLYEEAEQKARKLSGDENSS